MKKVKIIANPSSGKELAITVLKELLPLFGAHGISLHLDFTLGPGDAARSAERDDGEELIVSIGGDGTVHEVVGGMVAGSRKVPLAIFPGGTVNDFAEYLKIPKDPKEFFRMLQRGHTISSDVGLANDRAFINVCAGGLFADVGYSVEGSTKTALGKFAYYLEGFRTFLSRDPEDEKSFPLRIEMEEGSLEVDAMLFLIANSTSVGGFEHMARRASIDDGKLDVIVIEEMKIPDALRLLDDLRRGKHTENEKVHYFQTAAFTVESDREIPVDIDGEEGGRLPLKIRVLERALTIVDNQ
ncbi:MAG: diacylglycerol kinase family lipid kinase [Tissierellia bacterium]|nr:diacylglycerol kinase family lipid kinase [Tissierellia bacterium]